MLSLLCMKANTQVTRRENPPTQFKLPSKDPKWNGSVWIGSSEQHKSEAREPKTLYFIMG